MGYTRGDARGSVDLRYRENTAHSKHAVFQCVDEAEFSL